MSGVIFHICNRGALREKIAMDDLDYAVLEKTLAESLAMYPVRLYAYCLMPNHWHLLLEPESNRALSKILQRFTSTQARRFRRRHGNEGLGALYQSRFRCHAVKANEVFLKVAHYIERNPVEAGLTKKATSWPWSSAPHGKKKSLSLHPWPIAKPSCWKETLELRLKSPWLEQIRMALRKQTLLQAEMEEQKSSPDEGEAAGGEFAKSKERV